MKKILFGLTLTLVLIGGGCVTANPTKNTAPSTSVELSADDLASILLYEVDVLGRVFAVRPQVVEFNSQLDQANDAAEYFVARSWLDKLTGDLAISTSISKYPSAAVAETQIIELADDHERVTPTQTAGDTFLAYATPAGDTGPAGVTYRFTVDQYGVRITVYDRGDDTQADMVELASDLAALQLSKLGDVFVLGATQYSNPAIQQLPDSVTGGEYLGTGVVTAQQWLGTIHNIEADTIAGFKTGGLRRWQLTSRPDEVVEVVVIEMETDTAAADYAGAFLGSSLGVTELELPASIAAMADAIQNDQAMELQASQGNYMIDVSIFSPFGEIDPTAAAEDLVSISEKVITNFSEQT